MLTGKLNQVVGKTRKLSFGLAIDVLASKCDNQNKQSIRWTIYSNLKSLFDDWERALVELGFAHKDANGNTISPDN